MALPELDRGERCAEPSLQPLPQLLDLLSGWRPLLHVEVLLNYRHHVCVPVAPEADQRVSESAYRSDCESALLSSCRRALKGCHRLPIASGSHGKLHLLHAIFQRRHVRVRGEGRGDRVWELR